MGQTWGARRKGNAHLLQQVLAVTPQGAQLGVEEAAQVHHSFLLAFHQLQSCLQPEHRCSLKLNLHLSSGLHLP